MNSATQKSGAMRKSSPPWIAWIRNLLMGTKRSKTPLKLKDTRTSILESLSNLSVKLEDDDRKELEKIRSRLDDVDFLDIHELVTIGGDLNKLYLKIQEDDDNFEICTYFEYASSILTLHIIGSAGGGPAEFVQLMNEVTDKKSKKLLS